ncbi:LysR family transcriptional regulator [Microbacterium enclense]|uniref:DNA-binding transcriptional regulator, LysR family n=1 Tax=Microbacterium enclense TaxID=993073 RepID=A0A1G6GWW0_9MICO|nr:LysR family transcriptional regulator [Microbacterium enclense]KSU56023.1 hypothetical protein AS029_02715 [Microbacterium enclense]SDB86517.1 DNA-binding transcriptional regulator, LysR family [Microbacterium enclense]
MTTLLQLRILSAVRDTGSITRTAAQLGYSVPSIAHHLDALEREVGVRLVERERRGTRLTPLGAGFAADGDVVLARMSAAERSLRKRREAGLPILRVATFSSIGAQLLPSAIARLQRRSSIDVEIVEAEPTDAVRLLDDGDVDVSIIFDYAVDPFALPDSLVTRRLLGEQYHVLTPANGNLPSDGPLDFAALRDHPWVFSRSDVEPSDRAIRRVCRSVGYEPRVLMRTDDLGMAHGLVAEGLGLALSTPRSVDDRFAVRLRPAVQDLGERQVWIVSHRDRRPPAVQWLTELLVSLVS